ncbi:MAG: sporulation transcriptional regulator SpoIIID [Desulfotomaculales bacterium]
MQEYIQKRVLDICAYILETNATVRQAAVVFKVSKSTVHKDMTERLPSLNKKLAQRVRHVLDQNKAERHIRGGEATRRKYREKEGIILPAQEGNHRKM